MNAGLAIGPTNANDEPDPKGFRNPHRIRLTSRLGAVAWCCEDCLTNVNRGGLRGLVQNRAADITASAHPVTAVVPSAETKTSNTESNAATRTRSGGFN